MNKLPVIFIAAMLTLPAVAQAAPIPESDVGLPICGELRDMQNPVVQHCDAVLPADQYVSTSWSSNNTRMTRTYARFAAYNTVPWMWIHVAWFKPDAWFTPTEYQKDPNPRLVGADFAATNTQNKPDCPRWEESANPGGPPALVGGYPGLKTNHDLLLQVCGIDSLIPPTGDTTPEPTEPVAQTPVVDPTTTTAALVKCAAFKVGVRSVAVTSRGVACAPARNLLARFVKRGVEPSGYTCVKVRLGRQVAAKCAKSKGKSRAAAKPIVVEGRWRV
jgi:hypothetical protein